MTCVVGLVQGGKVWIGGDSAARISDSVVLRTKDQKVFFKTPSSSEEAELLVGCSGSARLAQAIHYGFGTGLMPRNPADPMAVMVSRFIPELRQLIEREGLHPGEGAPPGASIDGQLLVGYCGHLYRVDSGLAVLEPEVKFDAIGCAGDIALGFMAASLSTRSQAVDLETTLLNPEVAVRRALEAAELLSPDVASPFTIHTLLPADRRRGDE